MRHALSVYASSHRLTILFMFQITKIQAKDSKHGHQQRERSHGDDGHRPAPRPIQPVRRRHQHVRARCQHVRARRQHVRAR